MKKHHFYFLIAFLFLPQIVFGAWWNPLSWFGNWTFSEPNFQSQTSITDEHTPKVIRMTREEFKAKYGVEAPSSDEGKGTVTPDVSSSMPTAKQSPKIEPVIPPPVVVKQQPQPTAAFSNQHEIKEWLDRLAFTIADHQNTVRLLEKNSEFVSGKQKEWVPKLGRIEESMAMAFLSASVLFKTINDGFVKEVNSEIFKLSSASNQIRVTGYVSEEVRNLYNAERVMSFKKDISVRANVALEEYNRNTKEVFGYLELLNEGKDLPPLHFPTYSPPSSNQSSEYSQRLEEVKNQIRAECQANGGFCTESQIIANATQRLKDMGITSPSSSYGGFNIPSYNSIKCNFLNGGYDCYGSDGTRIQSNQIPGTNSFEINSW